MNENVPPNNLPQISPSSERAFRLLKKPPFKFHFDKQQYLIEIDQEIETRVWRLTATEVLEEADNSPINTGPSRTSWILFSGPDESNLKNAILKIRLTAKTGSRQFQIFAGMVQSKDAFPDP